MFSMSIEKQLTILTIELREYMGDKLNDNGNIWDLKRSGRWGRGLRDKGAWLNRRLQPSS